MKQRLKKGTQIICSFNFGMTWYDFFDFDMILQVKEHLDVKYFFKAQPKHTELQTVYMLLCLYI